MSFLGDISSKMEQFTKRAERSDLPDDSGKNLMGRSDLPDDSGKNLMVHSDLPDDSGKDLLAHSDLPGDSESLNQASDTLSANLLEENTTGTDSSNIIDKQCSVIERVENGSEPLDSTQKCGNYGEMKTDVLFYKMGYIRISLDCITSLDDKGHQGIDGIYYNPDGKPPYIIVDAKFNTATLSETKDGKQMCLEWIDKRLDDAVGKDRADEIREAMLDGNVGFYVSRVAPGGDLSAPAIYEKLDSDGNVISKGEDL